MITKQTFNLEVTKPDGNLETYTFNGGSLTRFCQGIGLGYNIFKRTISSEEGIKVKKRYPDTRHKWPVGSILKVSPKRS